MVFFTDIIDMKRYTFILLIAISITTILAAQTSDAFRQEGIASWYGGEFDGKPTASGEIFNSGYFTAAHPTLPFGTILVITNTQNNRRVTVRVNDRGPFVASRIIDLSKAAAEVLDMLVTGTAPVIVERAANTALGPGGEPVISRTPEVPPAQPVPAAPAPAVSVPAPPALQPEPVASVPGGPVTTLPPEPDESTPVASVPGGPVTVPQPEPVQPSPAVSVPAAPTPAPQPAPVPSAPASQPAPIQPALTAPIAAPAVVRGGIPPAGSTRLYRLQVGAYGVPRNAVDAFDKLKNSGFNPAYEKIGDLYRVVIPNLRAGDIPSAAQTLGNLGFPEALIREETSQ